MYGKTMKTKTDLDKPKGTLPLGEILINDGYVSSEQLKEALGTQREELSYPLGKILVKLHFVSPADMEKAIDVIGENRKLGDFLLKNNFIDKAQLDEALEQQKETKEFLGKTLVGLKYLTREQLVQALTQQTNRPRLGRWLVDNGLITESNLKLAKKIKSRGRRIGDILVDLGYISRKELDKVIESYNKRESLESILVKEGFITKEQLLEAKADPAYKKENLATILISRGLLEEWQGLEAESLRYEIPLQRFEQVHYSKEDKKILSSIASSAYSLKYKLIPAFISDGQITIGLSEPRPSSLDQINYLKQINKGYDFDICFISRRDFDHIYRLLFDEASPVSLKESSTMELIYEGGTEKQIKQLENIHQSEAINLVNLLITKGIQMGATDIHIENDISGNVNIRYRVDGLLRNIDEPEITRAVKSSILPIISRIKVISGMDLAERRLPQDGAFQMVYKNPESRKSYPIDFRVSTVKGYGLGENVAIRILDPEAARLTLDALNYSSKDLITIKKLLNTPSGLFLLTGPSGCGKSTTLYACLQYLNDPKINIVTVEDPVEYVLPNITQVNTNPRIDLTYGRVLRSFLRQDPDVILIGEIRDSETAETTIRAAETGHLVLSTLHTPDPITAILRLIDLDISTESLASTLLGIISQRLAKINCPDCSREYFPPESEWRNFYEEFPIEKHFYKGVGCKSCDFSGYKGRKPVYELFQVDHRIQDLLRSGADIKQVRDAALANGMLSMVECGISNTKEFSLPEISRITPYNIIEEFWTNPTIKNRNKNS